MGKVSTLFLVSVDKNRVWFWVLWLVVVFAVVGIEPRISKCSPTELHLQPKNTKFFSAFCGWVLFFRNTSQFRLEQVLN